MDLEALAVELSEVIESGRSVFLKAEPETPDHTIRAQFKIVVCGTNKRVELDVTPENFMLVAAQFDATIFDKEHVDRLYTWNFKALCTYFRAFCQKNLLPANSIIDLKCIEYFLGIRKNAPENLREAIDRTSAISKFSGWARIYKAVHLPLSLKVLPVIETTPVLNEATKRSEFSYYEIESTISGRMKALKKYSKCYSPHHIGPDDRKRLKPRGYGYRFLYADYRHCEITVLQWLSGDPKLKELHELGGDIYTHIYKIITGDECNTEMKRDMAKKMIISVMYGSGAAKLGEILGIGETVAKELINRIKVVFKTACDWMADQREKAKSGVFTDYFGRPRDFTAEPYKAPDIMVQGVAATVCQEKLIDLFNALKDPAKAHILFSVHDGFGLAVQVSAARETYRTVKDTLETESKLCQNLKLNVQIKFGAKLDNLKVLWKD
jgi:hypothetical protein